MATLVISIISAIVAITMAIALVRRHLKKKLEVLSRKIEHISPPFCEPTDKKSQNKHAQLNETQFVDIPTDLNNHFHEKIISHSQGLGFIDYYRPYFHEASSFAKRLRILKLVPPKTIINFVNDFKGTSRYSGAYVKKHIAEVLKV